MHVLIHKLPIFPCILVHRMMVKIWATKSMYKSVSFDNCNDENVKKNNSGRVYLRLSVKQTIEAWGRWDRSLVLE